jgi:hypothetical protein
MRFCHIFYGLFMVLLTGCNLGAVSSPEAPVTLTADIDPPSLTATHIVHRGPTLAPTATPEPTSTPLPTATRIPTSAPPPCVISDPGWPLYTVQRGDTLYSIAQRSGSSIDELSRINCLSDPGNLQAGQQLYVPRLPDAESESWLSYKWYAGGLTFNYAPGWTVQEDNQRVTITTCDPKNPPAMAAWTAQTMRMDIQRVTAPYEDLRAWADAAYNELYACTEVHNRGEVTLPNGYRAYRLDEVSGAGHLVINYYTIMNGNQIYIRHTGGDPTPAAFVLGTLEVLN